MNKAIFLDRDGTINVEVDYLHECKKLEFVPGAVEALMILQNKGYKLIVITNQSGVGRGYFPIEDVYKVNEYMSQLLSEQGVTIDDFYCCPHTEKDNCQCRKPQPGMYLKAAKEHDVDFSKSYMVGDKITDVQAAFELGCGFGLVLSGHDIKMEYQEQYNGHCYKDLLEFAKSI